MKSKAVRVALYVLGAVACVFTVAVGVSAVAGCDWGAVAGAFATLLSIVLAMVSIIYTYHTNRDTEELLTKIENQSTRMMERINAELRKGNFGWQNIEYLEEKFATERGDDNTE